MAIELCLARITKFRSIFLAVEVVIDDDFIRAFVFPPVSDFFVLVVINVSAFGFMVYCCRVKREYIILISTAGFDCLLLPNRAMPITSKVFDYPAVFNEEIEKMVTHVSSHLIFCIHLHTNSVTK